ncbi:Vacuolar protein sorting-associated protein 16-like protein, partial [Operophtera brumata]
MSALLTADWFQLDSYYRKFDLYNMNWSMDEGLENMLVSGAAYGGPIAVVRDRKQFVRITTTAKPVITIYNCAGNVIAKILVNGEQLLCIQESGDVLIYDMFGAYQRTFSLGQEVRDTKVCKAQLFPNQHGVGIGVITTSNRMFLLSNVSEPKVRSVPDLPMASQNGKHVAMFTDSGFLWIGSADFKTNYSEIDTGTSFPYDGPFHLVQEMDCVRVVSELSHELVQKVPFVVEKIFRINSAAAGSFLLEASKQYQKRSHRADEYIRMVRPDLPTAVQDCLEAAAFEFSPPVQRALVRAAQFGKGFLADPELTDLYVRTCRWLRVLNAVRDPKVAIPLTSVQYPFTNLQYRLIWRRLHCLATHIAQYLQLKDGRTRVLSHWACYKVSQPHLDNESAAREIGEKLRNGPAALLKATASGDTDLVYIVLLHLKEKMGKHEFELTIRSFPLAHALYIKYCAGHNREALRQMHVQEDDFHAQAASHIRDAVEQANPGSVEASLVSARECYKKGKNDLACRRRTAPASWATLCTTPSRCCSTRGRASWRRNCALNTRCRTEALAEKGEWDELDRFSKLKKSPAGYEPFVDACLKYGRPEEALNALLFVQNKCPLNESTQHAKISALLAQLPAR